MPAINPTRREFKQLLLFMAAVYLIVLAHTWILYPFLATATIFYQAFLRLWVAILPLFFSYLLVRSELRSPAFYLFLMLWLFFIPYPLYNFLQLRHIAEIVSIPEGQFFTDANHVGMLWKILPVCAYAGFQFIAFIWCLHTVATTVIGRSRKVLFEVTAIVYVSLSVVIGLASRLDTFHIVTSPFDSLQAMLTVFDHPGLQLAVVSLFFFATFLYYSTCWLYKYFPLRD